jgi:hypothetical protein
MRIIREYSNFKKKETTPITLKVGGGLEIYFDVERVEEIRKVIREYLTTIPELDGDIYGPNRNINISGKTINSKYISLMPNNISVLVAVWYAAKSTGHNIITADDFIFWTKNNLKDLFHPSGKFFNSIYLRLDKASNLGEESELGAIPFFTNYAKENGVDVNLMKAKDIKDDAFGGIDLYFVHNGKTITIQVKTLRDINKQIYNEEECYVVGIRGDLTEIKTDYLILMSSDSKFPSYIFRGRKDDKRIIIDTDLLKYIIPEGNLVTKKSLN